MSRASIGDLLAEYDRAVAHTDAMWTDLSIEELHWRPVERSSAIGWHVGHQAAVAHYLVRNLTAAEPLIDPELDALMDSATDEVDRGALPGPDRLARYRSTVAQRVHARLEDIDAGNVGAPDQLRLIGTGLLVAVVNHEYQHAKWIGEVRSGPLGRPLPDPPTSDRLTTVDGYLVVT